MTVVLFHIPPFPDPEQTATEARRTGAREPEAVGGQPREGQEFTESSPPSSESFVFHGPGDVQVLTFSGCQ